jgi:hypothetical protein
MHHSSISLTRLRNIIQPHTDWKRTLQHSSKMTRRSIHVMLSMLILLKQDCSSFQAASSPHLYFSASIADGARPTSALCVYTPEQEEDDRMQKDVGEKELESLVQKLDMSADDAATKKKDNDAMAFLRNMGKVGGAANQDFTNAVGSDEGAGMAAAKNLASTASPVRKSKTAYLDATESGIIDDMSDAFPMTSSGTEWRGVSDRVRGGTSEGSIKREVIDDKTSNVLVGHVTGENGFIQMVTELSKDPSKASVDASDYDGIEIDVLSKEGFAFNIHLRTSGNLDDNSFRHTVTLECLFGWSTNRIPLSSFVDRAGTSVDYSQLKRIGIVALEKETDVYLAVGGVRFYNVI